MNMISIQNILKFRQTEKLSRFIKVQGNLDFNEFIADAMVAQIWSFCTEIEYDVIRQLFLTNSFFPTTFHMIGDNN